jgi:hypothetical protein
MSPPSSRSKNKPSRKSELCLLPASRWCLVWHILRQWRWNRHFPPKRRLTFNAIHCVIFQKIKLFMYIHIICPVLHVCIRHDNRNFDMSLYYLQCIKVLCQSCPCTVDHTVCYAAIVYQSLKRPLASLLPNLSLIFFVTGLQFNSLHIYKQVV